MSANVESMFYVRQTPWHGLGVKVNEALSSKEALIEYGLEPKLFHRPAIGERGKLIYFYGVFKTVNGGYGFVVMSKLQMDEYAKSYSKAYDSAYSPWKTNYEEMAKKTVIKQALKYAPIKTDLQKAISSDMSVKKEISDDMSIVCNEVKEYEQVG